MNACVIGYGTVGKATAAAFGIEKYYSRHDKNITLAEAKKCQYIFICLPTPTVNGKCDTHDIFTVLETLESYAPNDNLTYIIRSTVIPGFSHGVQEILGIKNIVSNPEFLSEDTAMADAANPDLIVLGADDRKYADKVKALYEGRFKYKDILVTDSITAELIKYSLNTFFATKVIFANEIYDYAQDIGANYSTIKGVLEKHPWGSKNHFDVWYKEKRGVHGKCLPKDMEALATASESPLFNVLMTINERIKNEHI